MPALIARLLACVIVATSLGAAAAPRYVSDELSINLRRGPATSFRITELVAAGTPVEVLDTAQGWSKVRTAGGEEGYVLTRFLSDQPAAVNQVAQMKARVGELEKTNAALQEELAQALGGSAQLGQLKQQLVAENKSLSAELTQIRRVSANAIRIRQENQEFRERILSMETEVAQLRSENQSLRSRRDGMKVGALILVGGIVLGLVLPLLRRRVRNNWESL